MMSLDTETICAEVESEGDEIECVEEQVKEINFATGPGIGMEFKFYKIWFLDLNYH